MAGMKNNSTAFLTNPQLLLSLKQARKNKTNFFLVFRWPIWVFYWLTFSDTTKHKKTRKTFYRKGFTSKQTEPKVKANAIELLLLLLSNKEEIIPVWH
jgi:uncharacterized protein with PQ loop repeat